MGRDEGQARDEKEECSICLQEMGEHTLTTPCNHKFCTLCITKHLMSEEMNKNRCPLCRTVLYRNADFRREDFIHGGEENEDEDEDEEEDEEDESLHTFLATVIPNGIVKSVFVFPINGKTKFISLITSRNEDEDDMIKIWDYESKSLDRYLGPLHARELFSVYPIHINGKPKIICTTDQNIEIWDYETNSFDKTLTGGPSNNCPSDNNVLSCFAFSDDEKEEDGGKIKIVSGNADNTIKIFDYHQGICEETIHARTRTNWRSRKEIMYVFACVINGKTKIISGQERRIDIWDYNERHCEQTISDGSTISKVYTIQNNGKTKIIFGNYVDNTIKIWDYDINSIEKTLVDHIGSGLIFSGFAFLYNEKIKIISFCIDFAIEIWDYETNSIEKTLFGHTDNVYSASTFWDNEEMKIVSGGRDQTIKLWDYDS